MLQESYPTFGDCACLCNYLGRGLFLPEQSVGVLEVGKYSANENGAEQRKMIQCLVYSSQHAAAFENMLLTIRLYSTQSLTVITTFGCLYAVSKKIIIAMCVDVCVL